MTYKPWKDLDHVERYAARRYASWDQRWLDSRERAIVQNLIEQHGLSGFILDLPSGYGRFVSILTGAGRVVAADLGFFPLLYRKQRGSLAVGYVNADAQKLPFRDQSVDVIFCFRLFQHLHRAADRLAILREFRRVSRKWVVLSVYGSTPLHKLFRWLVPQPSRITMVDQGRFSEELEEADLRPVDNVAVIPYLHAQRVHLLSSDRLGVGS